MEQQDGSADLFANFAGVMILLVVVLMMSVNIRESLVNVQNNSAPQQSSQPSIDTKNLALLEVAYKDKDSITFYWQQDAKSEKKQFEEYEKIRTLFTDKRPDGIRLRLDDRIPSGIYKKILADAASFEIAIYQSDKAGAKK